MATYLLAFVPDNVYAFNAQHKNLFMPISRKSNCNFKTLCLCSCPHRSPNATKMLNTKNLYLSAFIMPARQTYDSVSR